VTRLTQLLDSTLACDPDRPAVIGERTFTYRGLEDQAVRLATRWLNAELRPNDRVVLWMRNCPELIVSYLACWKVGLIAVPVDYRFQPPQLRFILRHSEARAVVIDAERQADLAATEQLSELAQVLVIGGPLTLERAEPFETTGQTPNGPARWPLLLGDQLSVICYTSGTTSRPKGVVHSGQRILRRVEKIIRECRLDADTVSLVCLSLMRPLALQVQCLAVLAVGGCVVPLSHFSPAVFWEAYSRPPARTLLAFTPNLLADVLAHPAARCADHSRLRVCLAGGDAVPLPLHARFREVTGLELTELCGMTETGPYAMNPPFGRKKLGTIGLPLEGVKLRIIDEHGDDLPRGRLGQIVVQTPDLMLGYWNDTVQTFMVLRDGWLYTGDIGQIDEEGYVHFDGRIKDVIVRDGMNISPIEVEEALEAHPAVDEAVAVGADDRPHGQAVVAFVCWGPAWTGELSIEELQRRVAARLPAPAVPRVIHVLDRWPSTAHGKIDRERLRWLAAAGRLDL
jgi:acyl-CoA synthetase (AMP-forming)/AMP-acid ligase II